MGNLNFMLGRVEHEKTSITLGPGLSLLAYYGKKKTTSNNSLVYFCYEMSCRMGKPTICIGENKGADQLRSNCEADHAFVFAPQIVQ